MEACEQEYPTGLVSRGDSRAKARQVQTEEGVAYELAELS